MFKNFLVTTIRNFQIHKQYSLLSLLVMAIGLTTATLTFLYVRYEFSYENWVPDVDRIYRLEQTFHFPGAPEVKVSLTSPMHGQALQNYFPEIESHTRSFQFLGTNIRSGEEAFSENNFVYTDPNFFNFFGIDIVQGEQKNPLGNLNSILLSEKAAKKYFGNENPIGKILTINNFRDHQVVGVFKDIPENSQFKIDFLALYDPGVFSPFASDLSFTTQWNFGIAQTFFKLKTETDIRVIEDRLEQFINKNYVHPNPVRAAMTPTEYVHERVRAIKDIHLYSENVDEITPTGSIGTVFGLVAIAILILAAVVVNYINLATAISTLRAKEISLKKTLGAKRSLISIQFIFEAIFLSVVSLVISLIFTLSTLPYFLQFLNLEVSSTQIFSGYDAIVFLIFMTLALGLFSGAYPALILSKINPIEALSSKNAARSVSSKIRSTLVTLQFSVSVGLLIAIFVVFKQTEFVTEMDIGVETKNITVLLTGTEESQSARLTLVDQIKSLPGVLAVGTSSDVPANGLPISTAIEVPGQTTGEALSGYYASVDEGFFEVYKIKPLVGRLLSENFPADQILELPLDTSGFVANILINEKAVSFLGFKTAEEALGKQIRMGGSNFNNSLISAVIVGVIPDFHFGSAYNEITPTFFIQRVDEFLRVSIRTAPGAFQQLQPQIDEVWQRVVPDALINKSQMEEMIASQYDNVNRQGNILLVLSGIAVFISCLGILGMAAFVVERKTKEIGIRKVLGAKVKDLVALLLIQFSKPVVVANLISWPIAWYFMNQWLSGFVYRIDLNLIPFVLSGLASLLIAWLVVSFYAFKAATANPIYALQDE